MSYDCDFNNIYNELNSDFEITVSAILNSMLYLFRNVDNIGNKSVLDNLFEVLNNFASRNKNKKVLDKLYNKIEIFLSNLDKSLDWVKVKKAEKYISSLKNIQNKCLINNIKKDNSDKYNFMMYLIFERRDTLLLHKYMLENMKMLLNSNSIMPAVFKSVIEKFILLDEDNEHEIKYFNQVINLFLKGKLGDILLKNKEFITVLKNANKSFAYDLVDRIEDELISTREELAKWYSVSFIFPHDLEEYSYTSKGMVDFTDKDIITIDEEGDMCLDDAIDVEVSRDGTYTFYIHLANPPSIIPYDSKTRLEAFKRSETIYLGDTEIPIFEDYLAKDILSILPNKKTNTMTFVMTVDTDFSILLDTVRLIPGVVVNKHKLSYDEVDMMLGRASGDALTKKLILISQICNRLSKDNLKIRSFHKLENYVMGKTDTNSAKADLSTSHRIVEQSMVFANRLPFILNSYLNLGLVFPYRVQPECTDENVRRIIDGIDRIDHNNERLKKIVKNYMLSASYSPTNIGHSGLGVNGYVRIGSGARRAMDDLALYVIDDLYFNKGPIEDFQAKQYFWESEIKYWCEYANNRIPENDNFANEYNYLLSKGKILDRRR